MKRTLFAFTTCLALTGIVGYCATRAVLFSASPAAAVPQEKITSYRDVIKKVLPAVVSIEVKPKIRVKQASLTPDKSSPFGNFFGLPDDIRKELERFHMQPPPQARPGHAFGSGFIIDSAGLIVTNNHVVQGADEVQVRLHDGRKFVGRKIKCDPRTDLAILWIDAKEALPLLKFGDSDAMEMGDRVLAIGAPSA